MNKSKRNAWRWHQLVLVALLVAAAGSTIQAAPARDVLPGLKQRRMRVRTLYHKTKTTVKDKKGALLRIVTLETWEQREGDKRRLRTVSRTQTGKDDASKAKATEAVTVDDGTNVWREVRRGPTLMVIKSASDPKKSELDALDRVGRSMIKGKEKVDGEPCVIIASGASHGDKSAESKYWVSEAYGIILKSEIKQLNGAVSETTTEKIEINEPIAGVSFSYTPPKGATVVDMDQFKGKPNRP